MEIHRKTHGLSLSIRGGWGLWMALGKAVRGRNSLESSLECEPFKSFFLGAAILSQLWDFRRVF